MTDIYTEHNQRTDFNLSSLIHETRTWPSYWQYKYRVGKAAQSITNWGSQ